MYFGYFINISPLKEVWPFICCVPSLVEIDPMVLERKILKICQCIFIILLLSHLGKECGPSFEQTWIPFTKRCLVPNWWKWPSGSGEDVFLIFVKVFSLIHSYLHLEKGGALHLNKLQSPSPKDAVCQVWLKLALWFWRRRWK